MKRLTESYGYFKPCDGCKEKCKLNVSCNELTKALNFLSAYEDTGLTPQQVSDLKERQRWIPMSERLPNATDGDYFGMILVRWDGRKPKPKLHSCIETVTVGKMLELYRPGQWDVTHWMPLPEPPEDETR